MLKITHRMNYLFHILLVMSLLVAVSCKEKKYPDPVTPEKALESFELRDGFKIEIFAAEPHVIDPVEMVFDEDGNAFVAEMPDYPFMPENGKGAGRIRILQDTNSDGRVDRNVIFADSILEATSMLPWKGGLIIAAAPYIYYLKDTDSDLRADFKEILFSGFFDDNSEAQITSLRFGIDNWIYAANNGQAGKVAFHRKPDAPALSMGGADFRFRLDRNEFELESGAAQFGQTIDDWGNRFITQNTLHIRQVVIPRRYLHRTASTPAPNPLFNISDHDLEMFQLTPPPYWRAERTKRRQQQYREQNLDRVEYAEDAFTGSSGGTIYDGDAFPKEYYGNIFTGDVAGNLIHRDVLVPSKDSPVMVAKRDDGETTKEFLASRDPWFRPSGFTVGPDGYLYVVDMYRQHIETPLSIPEDLKEDMDFLYGSEHGRIYRIRPEDLNSGEKKLPKLRDLPAAEYVKLLGHPNRWWRLQAQRLLLERQDQSVVKSVIEIFETHEEPHTRLHALYVLEGLNALNAKVVSRAVSDPHEGVQKHGLILAEPYPELLSLILKSTTASSLQVVLQATLSAGTFAGENVTDALAQVTNRYGQDRWIRTAVLSSEAGTSLQLIQTLAENSFFEKTEPWKLTFLEEFSMAIGSGKGPVEIRRLLALFTQFQMTANGAWQVAGMNGLFKGLDQNEKCAPKVKEWIKNTKVGSEQEAQRALTQLSKIYTKL